MPNIGIVGNEAAKFTLETELKARELIRALLSVPSAVLVSGGCYLGGIDIYAEEEADKLGIQKMIFLPAHKAWNNGYRPRNIKIAENSHVLHNIVVAEYPPVYHGMRFKECYHCGDDVPSHVKSGGCWTARYAIKIGHRAEWHVI